MKKDISGTEKFLVAFLGIPALVTCGFLVSFLWARILQDLWRWFVMTYWHASALPFWNACGLLLMVGILRVGLTRDKMEDEDSSYIAKATYPLISQTVAALFVWGFGYLYAIWGHLT